MKALVLAGGSGTRLRPLTHSIPKALVPVANRPIIHYVMDHISSVGITDVGVVVSPRTVDQIKNALSHDMWGLRITFLVQYEPLGLADTVIVAEEFLSKDPFLMVLSDNLIGGGIDRLVSRFSADNSADSAVLLKEVSDPTRFGVAVLDSEGLLTRVVEKPREFVSNLALVGAYCFSHEIHEAVRSIAPSWRGELEITDAIGHLLSKGRKVTAHKLEEWWMDCGNQSDLLEANRTVLSMTDHSYIHGQIDDASEVHGTVMVSENVVVSHSKLAGPLALAEGVKATRSILGPNISIGRNCVISDSKIENSVIMDDAVIDGVSMLKDSVIGSRTLIKGKSPLPSTRVIVGADAEVLV